MAKRKISDELHRKLSVAGKKGNRIGKSMGGKHSAEVRRQKTQAYKELQKKYDEFIQDNIKDMEKRANGALKIAARQINKAYKNEFDKQLIAFYNHYTPKEYIRKKNLHTAITEILHTNGKGGLYCGVVLSASDYESYFGSVQGLNDVYDESPERVFYQVINKGLHGRHISHHKRFKPSILDRMNTFHNKYSKQNNINQIVYKCLKDYARLNVYMRR